MGKINFKFLGGIALLLAVVLWLGISLSKNEGSQKQSAKSGTQLDAMVGKPFPDIQLADKDGKIYTTENFKGKNTVLFFNEGIMCYPACWDEMLGLAGDSRLNTGDSEVFSVVTDDPQQWVKARAEMPDLGKVALLFDRQATVSGQLGVLSLPSSMHAGTMPGHTYIVLDKQGIVRYVYDDPNMAKNGDKIAEAITNLK